MGFEPTRAEPTNLAGWRLNHSAKVSPLCDLYMESNPVQTVLEKLYMESNPEYNIPPLVCFMDLCHGIEP